MSDVSINPGPVAYPCVLFVPAQYILINSRLSVLYSCQQWIHAVCSGMSNSLYRDMQSRMDFSWTCLPCLLSALPFHDFLQHDESVVSSNGGAENDYSLVLPLASDVLSM